MRQGKTFVLLTAAIFAAFTIISCSKSDKKDDAPQEQPGKIPGMGEAGGEPQGTALTFPAGVSISGAPIKGEVCDTAYEAGSGGLVEVCVAFVNSNATAVSYTIPAGLIVISQNGDYQSGILIQNTTIALKAKSTTRVGIKLYCVNSGRHPSSGEITYKIGPVTNSPLLRELLDLLKNKKTALKEYPNFDGYFDAVSTIQMLVWLITDGQGLERTTLNAHLASIPNK
ncbi:hypothetical protein [Chitinophaga caseinilytica]|uniref:Uncharacterized protein n=1 Tax=Chitinophaga caseinilytica TaxID=2267521 RepID=A0ABZ2Z329_9BACT